MQLDGKRIIVTGAARGIGAEVVRAYVAEGAAVAAVDVRDELGQAVAEQANAGGPGSAAYHHADVAVRAEVQAAFATAVAHLGGLDALVNAAGVERHTPAEHITDDEWRLIMEVNVYGTLFTNQAAFEPLRAAGGGSIMNFGSDAGLIPYRNGAHYSASKGAVHSWTRSISGEWGAHGIRANSVVPAVWTPMYDDHRATMSPAELAAHDEQMKMVVPLGGKLGDPARDLAPVMVFLASDASRFITGQIISVNGGAGQVR
ncbi:MAG TPA: SDR family NAD(P)-dependent oxidoreductase [Mycobacteriales bacterium]|jgi:NAD(P)-dependent dehydrogenase (short-subunit alcohol dehydrogenase family)|nr:SDR family NAD(P)-dependent oxidoreductase [Mycobacteriales bacterium]